MADWEEKLAAVMNDPEMMKQIMALAQSMDSGTKTEEKPPPPESPSDMLDMDINLIKKLSGFAGQGSIDKNQQALLHALAPYLNSRRLSRLEKAMKAAKIAGLATFLIGR